MRIHHRAVSLFFLLQLLLCIPSCENNPLDRQKILRDWFLDGDTLSRNTLAQQIQSLDTLKKVITMRPTFLAGDSSTTLYDSQHDQFTVGWHLPQKKREPNEKIPLIIYLHGGCGTTLTTKGLRAWEMFSFLLDSIDVAIASPSANRSAPWWSALGMERIQMTIRYLSFYADIDPDRIFLAGVSDGGTGCYAVANTIPAPFAGFIAVSGFGGALEQLGVSLIPENLSQCQIYNINAGKDRLYPIEYVNSFLDALEKQGVTIKRKIYPDENHGFDYRESETAPLLSILRTWKRAKPTVVIQKGSSPKVVTRSALDAMRYLCHPSLDNIHYTIEPTGRN